MAMKKKISRNYLFRRLTIYLPSSYRSSHTANHHVLTPSINTKERARACSESLKKTQIFVVSFDDVFFVCLCAMKIINLRLIAAKNRVIWALIKGYFLFSIHVERAESRELRKIEKFKDRKSMILTCENCLFN